MQRLIAGLLSDHSAASALAEHGLETILARHTCAHRVDELLEMVDELNGASVLLPGKVGETL